MRAEPVTNPDLLDLRATIVTCIAAVGLTLQWMRGADLGFLLIDYETWPEQPWRLATACLLHGGLFHLIFNVLWVWRFGQIVEPVFGLLATAGMYVLFGAGGAAAQWAFRGGAIGLSGAVYGLFALLWALDRYHPRFRGVMDEGTTRLMAVWFFFCVAATALGWLRVANVAHGVGALLGGLLGLWLSPFPARRAAGRLGLPVAVVAIALLSTVGRPFVNVSGDRAYELAIDAMQRLEREEYEDAIVLYQRAIDRREDFAHAWHNLGYCYQELGRMNEARQAFARAEAIRRADSALDEPDRAPAEGLMDLSDRLRGGAEEG
ncbi:MAG: rhomboid family intramembrane serine protease [Planctomycetota bacterium]